MVSQHFRVGGGNPGSGATTPLVVRRTAAIGDALCASVVAQRLIDLGYEVGMQTHPNIHCVLRRVPRLYSLDVPGGHCHVDLDNAYENHPSRRLLHFHTMFFQRAQDQLRRSHIELGPPTNCRPRMKSRHNDVEATLTELAQYPRPWVMICPKSDSYAVRTVPDGIWHDAAKKVNGTKFWIGRHPAPAGIVDLKCQHFDRVINYLSVADLYLGAETGPMHVAAAFGVPCVVALQATDAAMTLNDQNDFITVGNGLECLHCQKNVCPKNQFQPPCQNINPDWLAATANARLQSRCSEDISAIIAVYQPEVRVLNQCLEQVLPQVQEVIVCAEGNSIVPPGALRNSKIKYVQTPQRRIGYGRNTNHGVRHSNGRYLLLLNDDVFLDPGAVEKLRAEMTPGVGEVAHLLRYPSGTIYFAGKHRSPGQKGWGHVDLRHYQPTIKDPCEAENVCGASVLVRREAFYQIGGFDEDYFIYAEDDDFCLRLRSHGWRIRYTPHATGVHMEHQSTVKIGDISSTVNHANGTFSRKWGPYLDWNINNSFGNFDYLRA